MKNRNVRKYLALALFVTLLTASFSACGKKQSEEVMKANPEEDTSEAEVTKLSDETVEAWLGGESVPEIDAQVKCIVENEAVWRQNDDDKTVMYAVMDMDGNGRMEVIGSCIEGSSNQSNNHIYEVNKGCDGFDEITIQMPKGYESNQPDFLSCYYPTCYIKDDERCYLIDSTVREGEDVYNTRYEIKKKGTALEVTHIGGSHVRWNNEGDADVEEYFDADGNEIDLTAFYNIEPDRYGEYAYYVSYFDWRSLENSEDLDLDIEAMLKNHLIGEFGENSDYWVDVYTDASKEAYKNLTGRVERLKGIDDSDNIIRVTTSSDDVQLTLEWGEWIDTPYYFHPLSEIFSIAMEPGVIYEFPGYLPEGRPEYRLVASKMGNSSVWYCEEDGYGGGYYEIYYEEPESFLPGEEDPIIDICKAYAGMLFEAGSVDALTTDYFWKTVANAAMLATLRTSDADAEGNVYLPEWLVDTYIAAMFPYSAYTIPEDGEPISYHPDHYERYTIKDALKYNDSNVEIISIGFNEFGQVLVDTSIKTDHGYEGVIIRLANDGGNIGNPFHFIISDASICVG